MDSLEQARAKLLDLCGTCGLDRGCRIHVSDLTPEDAIGPEADSDFAIMKGKERVIEARCGTSRGQAFTDQPSTWSGMLAEVLALDLSVVRYRAVFTAAMNAVLGRMGVASGTVHCRNEDPTRCGRELARRMEERFGRKRIGLMGLQPAILRGLVEQFDAEAVQVADLNPQNIGATKSGVPVWDGGADLPRLVEECDMALVTGSSIVNGTLDGIRQAFISAGKPVVFFGNTMSGAAALLSLDRRRPYAR
jgi:hypothetical protein